MLEDIILAFSSFPGAESFHAFQGVVAGFLLALAYIRRHGLESITITLIATWILIGFDRYEETEQAGISDKGWVDIKVFLILTWISAVATLAIHYAIRYWRRKRLTNENSMDIP